MDNSTESSSESGPLHQELNDLYIDGELPALDSLVRKTYFKYLKRTALQYTARANIDVTDHEMTKFAQEMELDALKTCMSSKVYRLNMLKKINNLKRMIYTNGPSAEKKLSKRKSTKRRSTKRKSTKRKRTKRNYSGNEMHNSNDELPRSFQKSDEIDMQPQPTVAKDRNVFCSVRSPIVEEYIPKGPIRQDNVDNDIYSTVYKQLSEMFQAEGSLCSGRYKDLRESSPSSVISSDRYFNHCDKNFWYLESEINGAQYNQNILNLYDLNETNYTIVADKIREFFGYENSPLIENSPKPLKKLSYICKARITWHVKKSLNVHYLKNEFRSADEFRILAKAIVTRFIQIDPFMGYRKMYKSIEKAFRKNKGNIQNIDQIQKIVSAASKYAS